jgi:hypothetical protein
MNSKFHAITIAPAAQTDKRAALFSIVGFSYAEPPLKLEVGRHYIIRSTIMSNYFYRVKVLKINNAGQWCESIDTTAYECLETGKLGKNLGKQNFTRCYFEIVKQYKSRLLRKKGREKV